MPLAAPRAAYRRLIDYHEPEPVDQLVRSFWLMVILDLVSVHDERRERTLRWMRSRDFTWWVGLTMPDADPRVIRVKLRQRAADALAREGRAGRRPSIAAPSLPP